MSPKGRMMNKYEREALDCARKFAFEAEAILRDEGVPEVSGVAAELDRIERGDLGFGDVASREFTIVGAATVAGVLINLFMWIGQIRRGQIKKGASRNEIIQDLIVRVFEDDTLSGAAKERLLNKALDSASEQKAR